MNLNAAIPLAAGLACCGLAALLLIAGRASQINRSLAVFCSSVALWNLSQFMIVIGWAEGWSMVFRAGWQAGFVLTPACLAHFCLTAVGEPKARLSAWFYGVYAAVAAAGAYGALLRTMTYSAGSFQFTPGPGAPLIPWLLVVPAGAVVVLWRARREFGPAAALVLPLGLLVGVMLRDAVWLAASPMDGRVLNVFSPRSNHAAAFCALFILLGVLHRGWFEFGPKLPRMMRGLLSWFLCFAAAEMILLTTTQWWRPGWAGAMEGYIVLAAVVASLTALALDRPVRVREKKVIPPPPPPAPPKHSAEQVRRAMQAVAEAKEGNVFKERLRNCLAEAMGMRMFLLYLRDEPGFEFVPFDSHPLEQPTTPEALSVNAPIIRAFTGEPMEYLQLAVKPAGGDQAEPAAAAYPQMRLWNAEWCFPLRVGPDLLGLLAFSCDPVNPSFSDEELRTLAEFCQTLALLTHKLCLTDELELIGRMSRGMAHDLKDLITPLKTLIELVGEDPGAEQRFGQLIPIAARNIEALQAYVDEALFYSRNRAPRITATRLDHALQKVVQLAQPQSRKKRVRVMLSPMAALTIQADEVLVQRMLSNILANAIDASDPNAQVEIEVQSLHKEPDRPPWVRIRVLDWGDGMSEDNLQKLLKGRFTTKGGRWSGLGLSIARQIAQLHGGHISIFSEQSVGTSVEVDLPGCARVPGMAGEGERSALPSEAKSFQKE